MVEANKPDTDNSASIEEDHELAVPDAGLLQFQKQRSTPKVVLSEVTHEGDENHLLQIDDFADCQDKGEGQYGMMQAGGEEKVIKELIRAGSLDPEGLPHPEDVSPSLRMKEKVLGDNFAKP